MSKYGVFSDPYFPVFSSNTGKYGPEKIPYLDTFYVVNVHNMIKHVKNLAAFAAKCFTDVSLFYEQNWFSWNCYNLCYTVNG